tara:strand:+ start:928 stop:1845 length:918 start_codon:yes stop_codon:yes gene_type:complete
MSLSAPQILSSNKVFPQYSSQVQKIILPGNRLHLQHGPINIIIKANGSSSCVKKAYGLAARRMDGMLEGLVNNLSLLRAPLSFKKDININDATSKHMISTVRQYRNYFITPMAAVAGAVADEILIAMSVVKGLNNIFVNNGGDIALFLGDGQKMKIGVVPDLSVAAPTASVQITSKDDIRGIATSGWDGHSLSLGIADAVTVLAKNAAVADTVATLIANEVNCNANCIDRAQAFKIDPDSDLGKKLVTIKVGSLNKKEINDALNRGARFAQKLIDKNKVFGVFIYLQGHNRSLGWPYQNIEVKTQ